MIHPKDKTRDNPRLQYSVCAKWKRLFGKNKGSFQGQFFGGCGYNRDGMHLAGDTIDVCDKCCNRECKRLSEQAPPPTRHHEEE